ncbi:uncharacterized protein [Taeniopygia guttata]|uniref:uncharacterized protein n=1 Tax=Taeniopygia guttata TaxID=59729 RepID=UPI003BB8CCB7
MQGRDEVVLPLPAPSRGGSPARHSRSFHAVFVVTATAMAPRGASRAGSAFLLPTRLRSASASYGRAAHRGCPGRPAGTQTRSRRDSPERRRGGGRGLTADEHHGTEALAGARAIAWRLVAAGPGSTGAGPPPAAAPQPAPHSNPAPRRAVARAPRAARPIGSEGGEVVMATAARPPLAERLLGGAPQARPMRRRRSGWAPPFWGPP